MNKKQPAINWEEANRREGLFLNASSKKQRNWRYAWEARYVAAQKFRFSDRITEINKQKHFLNNNLTTYILGLKLS